MLKILNWRALFNQLIILADSWIARKFEVQTIENAIPKIFATSVSLLSLIPRRSFLWKQESEQYILYNFSEVENLNGADKKKIFFESSSKVFYLTLPEDSTPSSYLIISMKRACTPAFTSQPTISSENKVNLNLKSFKNSPLLASSSWKRFMRALI